MKFLKLSFLVSFRNAPDGSWINTVERIMSILNIALQNVAMAKAKIPPIWHGGEKVDIEKLISSASSQAALRSVSKKYPQLNIADKYMTSTSGNRKTIMERFERLALHDEPIHAQVGGASSEDIELLQQVIHDFDPEFDPTFSAQSELKKMPNIAKLFGDGKHVRQRTYMFQIRQCQGDGCPFGCHCRLPDELATFTKHWVPDPMMKHPNDNSFRSFEDTREAQEKGEDTDERHMPSREKANKEPSSELKELDKQASKENAKAFDRDRVVNVVVCSSCRKPRVVYTDLGKSHKNYASIRDEYAKARPGLEESYMCGTALFSNPTTSLASKVRVKRAVTCFMTVHSHYYKSKSATFPLVCCYCGASDVEVEDSVLPRCSSCASDSTLEAIKSGKINKYEAAKSKRAGKAVTRSKKGGKGKGKAAKVAAVSQGVTTTPPTHTLYPAPSVTHPAPYTFTSHRAPVYPQLHELTAQSRRESWRTSLDWVLTIFQAIPTKRTLRARLRARVRLRARARARKLSK